MFFTTLPPLRGPPPLTQGRLFISVRGPPEPVSATLASVLRILANPSNRCAVSEPVSATLSSVLRTLANRFTQGSLKTLYKLPDN